MSPQNLNDIKCIWMSSGVIDYRLCDLDFDCDNCAFDKALRKRSAHPVTVKAEIKQNLFDKLRTRTENYPHAENLTILSDCLILRPVFQNSYMLGFSSFLWDLLEPIDQIHCSIEKGFYRKGDSFIELQGEWGSTVIPAPFDLFVVSTFINIVTKLVHGSWVGLIEVDAESINQKKVSREDFLSSTVEIVDSLAREYNLNSSFMTMQDGGKPVQYLYQIMGSKTYTKLLDQLFRR